MYWLDQKYIGLISFKLERFKRIQDKFNFRCPICGDSKKSKSKARAWFYSDNNKTNFHCYNCEAHFSFYDFLKLQDQHLFQQYLTEYFVEKNGSSIEESKSKVIQENKSFNLDIKKISDLNHEHPAKLYVIDRHIPEKFMSKLYYAPKFKKWVNKLIPNKFSSIDKDEPRLIIPFLDENGVFFGFQGRSFKKNDDMKYITIMLDSNKPKLYGLENLDKRKRIYVFEGPIDSMFIENSIASAGGKIESNLDMLKLKDNSIIIYDNEPRSVHTIKKMEKAIASGYKICIWPEHIKEKDVNLMIMSNIDVKSVIDDNIYCGLEATLKLWNWRKT